MNNVISFKERRATRKANGPAKVVDNVISLAEWCRAPRLHRTPNGVYFISHAFGGSNLAT